MLGLTSLGVFVALDADRLTGPLASTSVRAGTLTANRETTAMTDAAVAIDRLEALEILLQFAAEVALDHVLVFLDDLDDAVELLVGQGLGANIGADFGLFEDELGAAGADAVDVRKSGFDALFTGDVDTEKTGHGGEGRSGKDEDEVLTLALFQTRVFLVDDVDAPLPADDLAVRGAAFDGGANFHVFCS